MPYLVWMGTDDGQKVFPLVCRHRTTGQLSRRKSPSVDLIYSSKTDLINIGERVAERDGRLMAHGRVGPALPKTSESEELLVNPCVPRMNGN